MKRHSLLYFSLAHQTGKPVKQLCLYRNIHTFAFRLFHEVGLFPRILLSVLSKSNYLLTLTQLFKLLLPFDIHHLYGVCKKIF